MSKDTRHNPGKHPRAPENESAEQRVVQRFPKDSKPITVGELVAMFLEHCGVRTAFGVISIHNMPILDAFGRRADALQAKGMDPSIRFVPARSESGALNMADAFARVDGGLGVAVTSTGTAAGNACGAMVEALTAGTPVLHLTGQIEVPYLDQAVDSGAARRLFARWIERAQELPRGS